MVFALKLQTSCVLRITLKVSSGACHHHSGVCEFILADALKSSDSAGRLGGGVNTGPHQAALELSDSNCDRAGKIVGNLTGMWRDRSQI